MIIDVLKGACVFLPVQHISPLSAPFLPTTGCAEE